MQILPKCPFGLSFPKPPWGNLPLSRKLGICFRSIEPAELLAHRPKRPLPEKHWHRGTIPYCPFLRKHARLYCLSPLHPLLT